MTEGLHYVGQGNQRTGEFTASERIAYLLSRGKKIQKDNSGRSDSNLELIARNEGGAI